MKYMGSKSRIAKRIVPIIQDIIAEGFPYSICFEINTKFVYRVVRLPARVEKVQKVLEKQRVKSDFEQAQRVAWRILKDWVEAQMAILESEMVSFEELFLPYMITDNGSTVFESINQKQNLLIE